MSKWLSTQPEQLVSEWRALRNELKDLTDVEQILEKVEVHFAMLPRGSRTVDYYTPASWPTPWEIIYDKLYCNNAVTLLQYHTLMLLPNIDQEKIELYLIEDAQEEYIILVYDSKYMLNYYFGQVLDFEKNKRFFQINHKINKNEIPKIS